MIINDYKSNTENVTFPILVSDDSHGLAEFVTQGKWEEEYENEAEGGLVEAAPFIWRRRERRILKQPRVTCRG
ncbi:hypothetical protein SK128_015017, partial [Halocaridina rubra]